MILRGRLLNDPSQLPEVGWLRVDGGRIADRGEGDPPEEAIEPCVDDADQCVLICPGFIDAHLHLPQIDCVGFDAMQLLEWLQNVIYPAESRWRDEALAVRQIATAYQRLLHAGTLGYAAFLTSHFHGYIHVVRQGQQAPLRAIVGQALMDRNAPAELLGHAVARIAESKRSRVVASANPRFGPACTEELLQSAGEKAQHGAMVQTHLAESQAECQWVRELFPNEPHYTAVYERHGLLTPRTLLAHCVHLGQDEWKLIAERKSVVVHCPTANVFLKSGLFDLDAALEHGVRLALGSDIAAGPDISMPRVARAMIETAKARAMTTRPGAHIPTPAEAWRLITRGNAEALGWNDAGRLEIGAVADLLVLRVPADYLDRHLIGRLIYNWRDQFIAARIVAGRLHG